MIKVSFSCSQMKLIVPLFSTLVFAADPLDGDEYLDIVGIMRNQAGRYECKASNDVAMPDVKYVNVVVNCKYEGTAALLCPSSLNYSKHVSSQKMTHSDMKVCRSRDRR